MSISLPVVEAEVPGTAPGVPRKGVVTAPPDVIGVRARQHFQQCIDSLDGAFTVAVQAEDQQRLQRILTKVFLSIFAVSGSCHKRGFCCRNFTLTANGRFLKSQDEFEEACGDHPEWRIFVYKETNGRQATFTCSKLDTKTGLCTYYEQRPQVCREFPHSNLIMGMAPDAG